jgi:hypothetical protein
MVEAAVRWAERREKRRVTPADVHGRCDVEELFS